MSRIANRPLTKPREPNRLGDLAQVVAAIVLLIIPAFLYASQRAGLHQAQRRSAALEAELERLAERRQLLRIEIASELDPRRLHDKAGSFALGEPVAGQIHYLQRDDAALLITEVSEDIDGHP